MDNSSRIRMLICDLMDKGELRMCSVIREKSGSLLLKVRVDEMNDQEDGCLGGVSLNSNIHFRRKSQKQFDRDIKRVDKHSSNTNKSYISSRTRSKTELARADISPETTDDTSGTYFSGVASPEACHEDSPSEVQQSVSVNASPNPMDLATMHANVNTDCGSIIHRVDSDQELMDDSLSIDVITPEIEMPKAPEHSNICDKANSESPLASDSIDTSPRYDYNAIAKCIRLVIRKELPSAKQSSTPSTSSDCSDIT